MILREGLILATKCEDQERSLEFGPSWILVQLIVRHALEA
jgi:hypothetical protein